MRSWKKILHDRDYLILYFGPVVFLIGVGLIFGFFFIRQLRLEQHTPHATVETLLKSAQTLTELAASATTHQSDQGRLQEVIFTAADQLEHIFDASSKFALQAAFNTLLLSQGTKEYTLVDEKTKGGSSTIKAEIHLIVPSKGKDSKIIIIKLMKSRGNWYITELTEEP